MPAPLDPAPTAETSAGPCLGDTRVVQLLEGRLSAGERAEAEAHLDGCESCRLLVGAAAVTDGAPSRRPRGLERGASVGRYLVLSQLGRGGMGRVYEAYDPELDRRVAVKLLHPAGGAGDARRRLAREARALGKLSHPNVVQVYDAGEHEGQVFVAMELVPGQPLDRWCRGTPRPSWQEVLAAFLDAARGIEAAHAQGLVHRDVKPSNLLRGEDGRTRVADFGLATAHAEVDVDEHPPLSIASPFAETLPSPPSASAETLTETGSLVGTPLYMAPEQHEGHRATAASDQYSLCVALHEGLYGALPFTVEPGPYKGMNTRLLAAKRQGPPAAPPPGSPVPAWIFAALARGLAPAPDDRHPSIDALAAALREDPDAPRRTWRRTAAAVIAATALAGGAAAGLFAGGALQDPCRHPEQQLAGVWDDGVRARVRAALLGTGRTSAEGTAGRVVALLDAYGGEWSAMRGEVCREQRRGVQRREVVAVRDACLDRRRGQLEALTTLLAEKPDPEVVDKAVSAASGLYPIAYCADTEALTARVPPPEDPALRARVAALQPRVDRLDALYEAGKFKDGIALGAPLLEEAAAIPHPPLRAQVELAMGKLRMRAGDHEAAATLLRRAAASAAEARDDVLVATAWVWLLSTVGDRQRRFEEAGVIRALAPSVIARVQDERVQALWHTCEGNVLYRMGRLAEALAAHRRALALREKLGGPEHVDVANTLNNIGLVLADLGDYPGALDAHWRALAIREKTLGPEHPDVAMSLNNLGLALLESGDHEGALAALSRAQPVWEESFGAAHPDTAAVLANVGLALHALGDGPRAAAACERAVAIMEKAFGPDHVRVAYPLAALGRAQVLAGRLDAARASLERAVALHEKGPASADLALPLLGLGELALARGRPAEATAPLQRALGIEGARRPGDLRLALAEALWQVGAERPRARALGEEARATYERLHHRPGLARATAWLAGHPSPAGGPDVAHR